MRSLIVLVCVLGTAAALNCYQGQQNASVPISGSATACPSMSYSCLKVYDSVTNMVTRSCQTTNCTLNGVVSSTGFCQNATGSMNVNVNNPNMQQGMYGQSSTNVYCCCFGDGCNGAAAHSSLLLRYGWLAIPVLVFFNFQQSK
ncbi:hypothetical protein M3Y99_01588700 [Aphelenchoides fujianensis]|nr:hypothetical protein M3Y99_01588700 [Aphelenchoides fujianensis]